MQILAHDIKKDKDAYGQPQRDFGRNKRINSGEDLTHHICSYSQKVDEKIRPSI